MKKKILLSLLFTLFVGLPTLHAQKVKVLDGSWKNVKGIKSYKVEFDYDGLKVGWKKQESEMEYLKDRQRKRNAKVPESGDQWVASWNKNKEQDFPRRFKLLLAEHIEKRGGRVDDNADVRLLVKTLLIEPGHNVGISRSHAYVNFEYQFIDSTGKVLLTVQMLKVAGRVALGMDFDAGMRIGESYALAGKELAKYLNKYVLK